MPIYFNPCSTSWDAARSLCDDNGVTRGPCGTPCRECPERDSCEMDCNVEDKEHESSQENGAVDGDTVCCSSSDDKMAQYTDTLLKDKSSWLEQPNEMFPEALRLPDSKENAELAKPLMVVDSTDFQSASTWFKPGTLEDLLGLMRELSPPEKGGCKIVAGNTEIGIGKCFWAILCSTWTL